MLADQTVPEKQGILNVWSSQISRVKKLCPGLIEISIELKMLKMILADSYAHPIAKMGIFSATLQQCHKIYLYRHEVVGNFFMRTLSSKIVWCQRTRKIEKVILANYT